MRPKQASKKRSVARKGAIGWCQNFHSKKQFAAITAASELGKASRLCPPLHMAWKMRRDVEECLFIQNAHKKKTLKTNLVKSWDFTGLTNAKPLNKDAPQPWLITRTSKMITLYNTTFLSLHVYMFYKAQSTNVTGNWKTISGKQNQSTIKDLFKHTYFSLSDPHWRWTHIKSNNPYLTGGVVKHTQLCLNVRPKQGHPAFLIRPFRCGTLAITHSFQGDGTSHSQGGANQTALCPWRKKHWQKQACWKWVIWIWLIGMTFNRPSSSLRDHDQSMSPMICSHNHCITQYHGNPQPSF